MALDPSGLVNFSVMTNIDPSIISYETALGGSQPANAQTQ
jgi:hypothetical protein